MLIIGKIGHSIGCSCGNLLMYNELLFFQAFAAGFLEGHVTAELLHMNWINTVDGYCKVGSSGQKLRLKYWALVYWSLDRFLVRASNKINIISV